jgi:hypothetical protein
MWAAEDWLVAGITAIQVLGILALALARLGQRSTVPGRFQLLFLLCLLLVGLSAVVAAGCDNTYWIASGVTLAVMVVGGTLDCGGRHSAGSNSG